MYHVFARGTGYRVIFEDDSDRCEFCRRLGMLIQNVPGSLIAWCLMGNHFHLIVNMRIDVLSRFMKRLNGGYARCFNERHGRVGHLFEGRFGSEAISSDSQLLAAVRYVHRNPIAPGLSKTCDYQWSSYGEYTGVPCIVQPGLILGMCGGVDSFIEFHAYDGKDRFLDTPDGACAIRRRLSQDEAIAYAKSIIGEERFENLPGFPRGERDKYLQELSQAGLSIRQIELVTGVSRGVVHRAVSCGTHYRVRVTP